MKLVRQINSTTCGQACVAMVLGVSIETAIEIVGHKDCVSDEKMLAIFGKQFAAGNPPHNSVAIVKHKEPNGDREHWTVWNRGEVLDPACIGKKLWAAYKHIPIAE
mgnify:CR=1 FL=1